MIWNDLAAHLQLYANMPLCSTTFEFTVAEVPCGAERPISWLCFLGVYSTWLTPSLSPFNMIE